MQYVALDIGNVCIRIDRQKVLAGLDETGLSMFSELTQKLEFGFLPEDKFLQQISASLFPSLTAAQMREKYNSILCELIPGMEDFVRLLHEQGIGTAFFSDISTIHLNGFRRKFLPDQLLPGVYSFEVGSWKPSPQMFQTFEERYGIPLLYADDRKELVDAAIAHGWNAVVFQSAVQLKSLLLNK